MNAQLFIIIKPVASTHIFVLIAKISPSNPFEGSETSFEVQILLRKIVNMMDRLHLSLISHS